MGVHDESKSSTLQLRWNEDALLCVFDGPQKLPLPVLNDI
jgi:hypothetical protein